MQHVCTHCSTICSKVSSYPYESNYILAEGLYRAKIDPFADLHEINLDQRRLLFQELREVAFTSYAAQGLTRPQGGTYRSVDGSRGEFEFQLQCYGQTVSPNGNPVVKQVEGPHGRTIWVSIVCKRSVMFLLNIFQLMSIGIDTATKPTSVCCRRAVIHASNTKVSIQYQCQ